MIRPDCAADHSVSITQPHHHCPDQGQTAPHLDACHFLRNSVTAHDFRIRRPVLMKSLIVLRIGCLDVLPKLYS
jgi:hypothetical protein